MHKFPINFPIVYQCCIRFSRNLKYRSITLDFVNLERNANLPKLVTTYQGIVEKEMPLEKKRGALLVLEGCDKSGKTTQCNRLVKRLRNAGVKTQLMKFPDRGTLVGRMIDSYLQETCELDDNVIHLLFAANRWEAMPKMEEMLTSGITLVVDRYSFSGIAFSVAKGMNMNWCQQAERGLLQPDMVFFLSLSEEVASQRGDYGKERYEKKGIQTAAASVFHKMMDSTWIEIDADNSLETIEDGIFSHALMTVQSAEASSLYRLWDDL